MRERGRSERPALPPLLILPDGDWTKPELRKRLQWERLRRAGNGTTISVKLSTWRDGGGMLWTPGTSRALAAEEEDIDGDFAVATVNLRQGDEARSPTSPSSTRRPRRQGHDEGHQGQGDGRRRGVRCRRSGGLGMSRTNLFRPNSTRSTTRATCSSARAGAYAGEEVDRVHMVRQFGFHSNAPAGSHGIGIAAPASAVDRVSSGWRAPSIGQRRPSLARPRSTTPTARDLDRREGDAGRARQAACDRGRGA